MLIAAFFLTLLATACSTNSASQNRQDEDPERPATIEANPQILSELPITSRSFKMGTAGFIPRHYPEADDQEWQDFFEHIPASYGEIFGVHVKPGDRLNQDGIPEQVQLAFELVRGVEPYVAFSISSEDGAFTPERGEELKRVAVAVAAAYQPKYISLGIESNLLYLFQRDTFDLYVQFAREAYDEIKAVNPNILVMNNFQLEHMKGKTSLTGQGVEANWEVIDKFEGKMDLISFTVYPFLAYKNVEQIPIDHLNEMREHTSLPIMITETGWPSQDTSSGVHGSDQAQVDYLIKLIQQADAIDVEGMIWVFPHDADFGVAGGVFDHLSLLANDGNPKPGFEYWQAIMALPLE